MSDVKYRVAIVGCGRMGQVYAQAYSTYPDTEIVAIAEYLSGYGDRGDCGTGAGPWGSGSG